MSNERSEIEKAWDEFFMALCKSLKIDKMVYWMAEKLDKYFPSK